MPPEASRCASCNAFADWRRKIPASEVVLALLISLIAVLSAATPALYTAWNYRSKTMIRILGSETVTVQGHEAPVLVIAATNNGGKASVVSGASIAFERIPLMRTRLQFSDAAALVLQPGKTVILRVTALDLPTAPHATKQTVLNALPSGRIRVIFDVDETTRLGSRTKRHPDDRASGLMIQNLVEKRVP